MTVRLAWFMGGRASHPSVYHLEGRSVVLYTGLKVQVAMLRFGVLDARCGGLYTYVCMVVQRMGTVHSRGKCMNVIRLPRYKCSGSSMYYDPNRECRPTKVCGKRPKWESFDECYASDLRERIDCVWSSLMSAFHVYRMECERG